MYLYLFFRTENDTRSGRRSLRKREGKTYVEDDFDFMLGEDKSGPNSPLKGGKRRGSEAANANSRPNNSGGNSDHNTNNKATPLSNGDVEMESDEDDDDGRPLEPLPLPKVSQFYYYFQKKLVKIGDVKDFRNY